MYSLLILVACIVTANAAAVKEPDVDFTHALVSLAEDLSTFGQNTERSINGRYSEIVLQPLARLDDAVQSIENRRSESEECVDRYTEDVRRVVDQMHIEMEDCGVDGTMEALMIVVDIKDAVQQLVFDGYDLAMTFRRCRAYNNAILQKSCYARFTIKGTLYLKNARTSIKTIKQTTNERIPNLYATAEVCTNETADRAIAQLQDIERQVDNCIRHLRLV